MLRERVRQLCRSHPTADPVPHGEPLAPLPDWLRRAGNLIGDDDSGERLVGVADSLEPQDHGEYGYGILIRDVRTTR